MPAMPKSLRYVRMILVFCKGGVEVKRDRREEKQINSRMTLFI
jgi:hypothetical protein